MAANFRIQKPYSVAQLPLPFNQADARYFVGDVFGGLSKRGRRKRPELVVGISGESANIYDVSASRLITSYPIPPQQSFTCAPFSIRVRIEKQNAVVRYTYVATQDSTSRYISIFRDWVDSDGKTTSHSETRNLQCSSPVSYIALSSPPEKFTGEGGSDYSGSGVIVVCSDGEIISLDPETLQESWRQSMSSLLRDELSGASLHYQVQFAAISSATDIVQGIFGGKQENLQAPFPRPLDTNSFDPVTLILISDVSRNKAREQQITILSILPSQDPSDKSLQQTIPLCNASLPGPYPETEGSSRQCQVHVSSGTLLQFSGQKLHIFDLSNGLPKLTQDLHLPSATSFLRLSNLSILTCSPTTLNIYNAAYHSLQTTAPLELPKNEETVIMPARSDKTYELVSYFRRLDVAVGLFQGSLVALHIEPPGTNGKRRHADGMLIDSIGRGTQRQLSGTPSRRTKVRTNSFSTVLPGMATESYIAQCQTEMDKGDQFLANGDLNGFESMLADKFGVERAHGVEGDKGELPEWRWLEESSRYPAVDRRWILYSIRRVFQIESDTSDPATFQLKLLRPSSNVLIYLVVAGHMTLANLKSAFRDASDLLDDILSEQLIHRLVDIDPSTDILFNLVSATRMGPVELVTVIRSVMRSLGFFQDPFKNEPKLLSQGQDDATKDDSDVVMELDNLEQQLQLTEFYLADESGRRVRCLTTALSKLVEHSTVSIVQSLRNGLKTDEIFSLIFILRGELVGGAWTSRYVDLASNGDETDTAPADGSITLIARLLSCCVDSIGPGGWLIAQSRGEHTEASDLLAALKLEISAALEGLQQAVSLNSMLAETIRHGHAMRPSATQKHVPANARGRESTLLPLGLSERQAVSSTKIVSGGEVIRRTQREIGHLVSKKVAEYSVERIVI